MASTATSWPAEATVEAAKDGDVESIAELIRASHPHVRRFAHALCATPQDAEDAAQEALIILYRKIGMLRASKALASWLFRIVRHECLRLFRPGALTMTMTMTMTEPEPVVARSVEEEVLTRLDAAEVARAIAALPTEQREVLILRDVRGLSGAATAEALALSLPAMKSRLHRARSALQGAIGPKEIL
ncbi:RNA polymerase sigma factor [Actinorhabdospora filicis]|uniref:RNA polymerase sigma factor n=1 Tax=Actinorhabdospora filicis TaxID=1785913 RepID=A0A9W6WDZ7_9ACTN|nr:RNA polymerase sigma factor [Actinorhabdospora filicis]GLZ81365.1 RNA polymerase sigma factor [Actinorhabdospora filicis]